MRFVDGATSAMVSLSQEPANVVVTDMKMPGYDGAQLLDTIREHWPRTLRFVLSGHASEEGHPRAIPVAHQWLAKPCERDALIAKLERACALQRRLHHQRVDAALELFAPHSLFPETHRRATEILVDGYATIAGITDLLEKQPILHRGFLELANSSWFSMPRIVTSVPEAIDLMGMRVVRQLILAAEVFEILRPTRDIGALTFGAFRERATCAAKLTARILDYAGSENPHATTAGLMNGLGFLLLWNRGPDLLEETTAEAARRRQPFRQVLKERLGVSDAELGAALLMRWDAPIELGEAVAMQDEARAYGAADIDLRSSLHVATSLLADPIHTREVQDSTLDQNFVAQHTLQDEIATWRAMADELALRCEHLSHAPEPV